MTYTPEKITELKDNEIFVFGSNEAGIHGAGAAHLAYTKFGAIWGKGVGMAGQTYAIPTKNKNIQTLPLYKIERYVNKFIAYAVFSPQFDFLVTKIGCGLAGYSIEEIAPLFKKKLPNNIILPKEFTV